MPDVFATTDDRLLGLGSRHSGVLGVRIMDVIALVREVLA